MRASRPTAALAAPGAALAQPFTSGWWVVASTSAPCATSRSTTASARRAPSSGSVPAAGSSSSTSERGPGGGEDRHQPAHVGRERGQALGDRLVVADVGEHPVEHRQAGPRGRHPQAALVQHRQQPERLQRHGLAAGVRAGDHQRPDALERQVDRHGRRRVEQRMAGGAQVDLGRRLDAAPVPRPRQGRPGEREVEGRQRGSQVVEGHALVADQPRERAQDARLLLGLLRRQLPHLVVCFDKLHGLDEERLPGAGAVVDDARHRRARRRLHRQHRAAAALGGERLLQVRAEPGGEGPQQVGGRAPGRGQAAPRRRQLGRGGVQQAAPRVEGALEGGLDAAGRGDVGRGEGRGQPGRLLAVAGDRVARLEPDADRGEHLGEGLGLEGRVARRGGGRRAQVGGAAGPADAQVAQAQRLLGLGRAAGDLARVGRWRQRAGELAAARERGQARQPLADGRQLEQLGASRVHGGRLAPRRARVRARCRAAA